MYDRMHNKLIEYKTHDAANSELYNYDSAYRLTSTAGGSQSTGARGYERGTFSDGTRTAMSTVNYYEDWDLDGLGNWSNVYKNSSTAQTRTHSDFNEIVNNDGAAQTHDKNGNLTNDGERALKWDAFGRLREVWDDTDTTQWAEYVYDSNNRRLRKVVTNGGIDGNATNGATDYAYHGWRSIEEIDGSGVIQRQIVYGTYLDEIWTLLDVVVGICHKFKHS